MTDNGRPWLQLGPDPAFNAYVTHRLRHERLHEAFVAEPKGKRWVRLGIACARQDRLLGRAIRRLVGKLV